jgi:hypothetical protein
MPSKYLFLSDAERDKTSTNALWNNLPTISQSTRECYLSLAEFKAEFQGNKGDGLFVKMNIPAQNYFSSDNSEPVLGLLDEPTTNDYIFNKDNKISILTNDNLKSVKIILTNLENTAINISSVDKINLVLKLDYVDQEAMVNQVLLEYPKHLK